MVSAKLSLFLGLLATSTFAAPIPFLDKLINGVSDLINGDDPVNKESVSTLAQTEISSFTRVAQFARASFCTAPVITAWACGEACDANPETQTILAGGDDGLIPGFFVAFDPPTKSVVVAHQGTKKKNILSVFNDIDIRLKKAPENRFPGAAAKGAEVHAGFLATFERTADQILAAVQQGIKEKGATNVLITGHSLGSGVGLYDSIFLRSKLDPAIKITTTLFGLPRAGNKEWADHVDQIQADQSFQFFVNGADPVPKVPPVEIGYRHPSGEIFQRNGTSGLETLRCPGQENENCSSGISLLQADTAIHKGPYAGGVFLGSKFCAT